MYISELYLVNSTTGVFLGKLFLIIVTETSLTGCFRKKIYIGHFYSIFEQCFYHIGFYIIGIMFLNGLMCKKISGTLTVSPGGRLKNIS